MTHPYGILLLMLCQFENLSFHQNTLEALGMKTHNPTNSFIWQPKLAGYLKNTGMGNIVKRVCKVENFVYSTNPYSLWQLN